MVESNGCEKRFRGRSDAVFPVVGESFCRASDERQLTVQKTSLFSHGDGFAVYEHHRWRQSGSPETGHDVGDVEEIGELVFRVDTYGDNSHPVVGKRSSAKDELVLMGPCGDCILTVRKKWPSLHQRWEGFLGEKVDGQKPLFSARRHSIVRNSSSVILVEVDGPSGGTGNREYRVEGSFSQRCCTVYDIFPDSVGTSGQDDSEDDNALAVAEIRRKSVRSPPSGQGSVVLGRDVFCLRLAPGLDAAFFMGLVLVLDRMTGDES